MKLLAVLISVLSLGFSNIAWVHYHAGQVHINPAGDKKKIIVPRNRMALRQGDLITTQAGGSIIIAMKTGTFVRLRPNSSLSIKKMNYKPEKSKSDVQLSIPQKGSLTSYIRKISKREKVTIRTPSGIVGVRGTELLVDVPDENTTIVALFTGKVIVSDFVSEQGLSTDNNTMMLDFLSEMSMSENSKFTVNKGKKPSDPVAIKEGEFTDEKKEARELKKASRELEKSLAADPDALDQETEKVRLEAESAD